MESWKALFPNFKLNNYVISSQNIISLKLVSECKILFLIPIKKVKTIGHVMYNLPRSSRSSAGIRGSLSLDVDFLRFNMVTMKISLFMSRNLTD